jgi:hypothetical protein
MITCSKCDEVNGVLWQSHIMSDCSYTQEQFINMISRTGDDV